MKRIRRNVIAALAVMITLLMVPGLARAGQLVYDVTLRANELEADQSGDYTLLSFPGAYCDAPQGHPLVPYLVKSYLLPAGTQVVDVRLEVSESRLVYVDAPLYPAQPPQPLGLAPVEFVPPVAEVYSSRVPVTDFTAEVAYEGLLHGERIVSVIIRPIRYTPASGEIEVAGQMSVTITCEADPEYTGGVSLTSSQLARLHSQLQRTVANPEPFSASARTLAEPDMSYRHAIIVPQSMSNAFMPLVDWNTSRGVRDTIVTLESINTGYTGVDLPDKMRNFVKFAYENWGLEYVLLGGDEPPMPTRDCWTRSTGEYPPSLDTIPTDMYFGCLDGNWNSDGDNTWGEMNDGVDLLPEVSVGRAAVKDAAEAALFVAKVQQYSENPPPGFANKLLLPSEILWTSPYYPGDATNNAIASMAPSGTRISKLYETQGTLTKQAVLDSLNAGVGLVHHAAHGSIVGISCADGTLFNFEAEALTNGNELSVYVSIACNVGNFDNTVNCLVEGFQRAQAGGTVAWLGNSRYGWGTPPGRGPSEDLDVSFFEDVYDQGNPRVGFSLDDAKIDNSTSWGNSTYGRWCIYELNLHGDPAMPVHYREISEFQVSYTPPYAGDQDWLVTVGSKAGYPVDGMLVCVRQNPGVYSWGHTDASGRVVLPIEPDPGRLTLVVTGANHKAYVNQNVQIEAPRPIISLSPDTVWVDAEVDPLWASFDIANQGSDTLRVTNIQPFQTDWIDSITPTNCEVFPAEQRSIDFYVDTSGIADNIYVGRISVASNDPDNPLVYQAVKLIKGDWPDIDFTPDTLVFDIPAGDSLTLPVLVDNLGRADLEVSSAVPSVPWITAVSPDSFTVPVDGSLEVYVTVDTTGKEFGKFEGSVVFETNDPDESPRSYPVVLNMGEPAITLSPDTMKFFYSYENPADNVTQDNMTVANEGDRLLIVTSITDNRPWLEVAGPTSFELEPGSSQNVMVYVYHQNRKHGIYNGSIFVRSNDPDEHEAIEPVEFSVVWAPPSISCSPDTAVMDIETWKGQFWIFNEGMRDLNIKKIHSDLPWIYDFIPEASFVIRGGDSARVVMIGDASQVPGAPKVGTVIIESNDTRNPDYEQYVQLGSASGISEILPYEFSLSPVTPNPVIASTLIAFAVPHSTSVSVACYNVAGQKVRSFAQGTVAPGFYTEIWRGEDDVGRRLPQGVYILRMDCSEYHSTQKLILVR